MSLNLIPAALTAPAAPLSDLLTRAAFAPLPALGWLRITGSDRVRWLNGMTTNNIAALQPGEGCYTFFLNAQGRIQADATAFMREDSILLETARDRIPALIAMLDRFIIMDDVELEVLSDRNGIAVAGPHAASILEATGLTHPGEHTLRAPFIAPLLHAMSGSATDLIHAHSPVVPCFELWSDPDTIGLLTNALEHAGTSPATPETLEHLRILSGTPLYGADIRDRDLPQETNQTRALHFAKGCYLGQEIVERIHSRGAVHRTFTGFILTGELPNPGAVLSDQAKPVGELTSVARIQLRNGPIQLALGYIRRETLDNSATITYPGGIASPSPLPFQLS